MRKRLQSADIAQAPQFSPEPGTDRIDEIEKIVSGPSLLTEARSSGVADTGESCLKGLLKLGTIDSEMSLSPVDG